MRFGTNPRKTLAIGALLSTVMTMTVAATPAGDVSTPYFEVPSTWTVHPDELGMAVTVLGPSDPSVQIPGEDAENEELPRRPVLSLASLGEVKNEAAVKEMIPTEAVYEEGRRKYLEENEGTLVEFKPAIVDTWMSGATVKSFGYRYVIGEEAFSEDSHFVTCNGKFYYIHALVAESQADDYEEEMNEIVRSFKCE